MIYPMVSDRQAQPDGRVSCRLCASTAWLAFIDGHRLPPASLLLELLHADAADARATAEPLAADGGAFYRHVAALGYDYAAPFLGITWLRRAGDTVGADLSAAGTPEPEGYAAAPWRLEHCLRTVLAARLKALEADGAHLLLPIGVERLACRARADRDGVEAELRITDAQGRPCCEMEGLRFARGDRRGLLGVAGAASTAGAAPPASAGCWSARPMPRAVPSPPRSARAMPASSGSIRATRMTRPAWPITPPPGPSPSALSTCTRTPPSISRWFVSSPARPPGVRTARCWSRRARRPWRVSRPSRRRTRCGGSAPRCGPRRSSRR